MLYIYGGRSDKNVNLARTKYTVLEKNYKVQTMTNNNSTYSRLGDYISEVDVRWLFAKRKKVKGGAEVF